MDPKERLSEAEGRYAEGLERIRTTPPPAAQKFAPGTRVWIQKDLGPIMSHFESGLWATVECTHAHAYGGDDVHSYALDLDGHGSNAWYDEEQLHLEEEDQPHSEKEN
jgi:hypothetical protein